MSTAIVGRVDSKTAPRPVSVTPAKTALIGLCCILFFGHFPLLVEHFCNLWIRPHYQFLIFLPVAVGLLWHRGFCSWREQTKSSGTSLFASTHLAVWGPCMAAAMAMLSISTALRSPWAAMASLIVTVLAVLLLLFGKRGFMAMLPGWLMLFAAMPLPGNLDVRLIETLRAMTTVWSSLVLDYFGVLHRVSGNVIEIPGISLFVADACTGIHSLFVLIVAAFFLCLWNRRTVIHTVVLICSTIGLVFVENIARVSLITALCQDNHSYAEGWRHSTMGFGLFAVSLLLIFSLDSLICVLIPVPDWRVVWKFIRNSQDAKTASAVRPESFWPLRTYLSRWMLPAYMICLVLGMIQLTWVPSRAEQLSRMMRQSPIDIRELGADMLPKEFEGWQQTDYQFVKRVLDDPMGEYSQQWTFEKDGHKAVLSLDYPYLRIHDLTLCYQGIGWEVRSKKVQQPDSPLPFADIRLAQALRGHSLLLFSLHSQDGHCEVALDEDLSLRQLYQKRFEYDRPWFQVQLLALTPVAMQDKMVEERLALFLGLRPLLLQQCQTTATPAE